MAGVASHWYVKLSIFEILHISVLSQIILMFFLKNESVNGKIIFSHMTPEIVSGKTPSVI